MPDPGSHGYDVRRTRLRSDHEKHGIPDQRADEEANAELEQEHPPRRPDDERAGGPRGVRGTSRGSPSLDEPASPAPGGITLRSSGFNDHAFIPERCSWDGGNVSPPLEWTTVPDGTAELVLVCEDVDAPGGSFIHWLVSGIPPTVTGMPEGQVPEGAVVGHNDYGERGWGGPRPPIGDSPHRYVFRLRAVDTPLGLDQNTPADQVSAAVRSHQIGSGTLVGLFAR
ncbi:YbhB/YbcL family Raf kinase inhibitor-like protein [Goodfellowiella coeruleoviolacea]|uniref:Phosphatidylethanolamine-binding protein n=1 Tax=Goodfellowiella coeruleoviolacea TaxID=334858 RepID=A0AAE3KFC1_9PSEU|nr:YbhB/YbcL family Raf kinase inhibitor-like protein [Goodfellowiella coeruleoviolacea]MCP2164269.1 hypothetical protein [Goodfellowiella coeruleoviolacea]